jgi:hypothetical protein
MDATKAKETDTRIRVAVRCRPLLGEESRTRKCLQIQGDLVVIGDKKFTFEQIYSENSKQKELYDDCIQTLVEGCFQGFNGTVFACKLRDFSIFFLSYFLFLP